MTYLPAAKAARNHGAKRFAATLAIAATALGLLTVAAVPAHADKNSDQVLGVLAGIAAVAIIADALGNNKPKPAAVPAQPAPAHAVALPNSCALWIEGQDRNAAIFSERCLNSQGYIYNLPTGCARNASIFGRNDRIYTARCLAQAGFSVGQWNGFH